MAGRADLRVPKKKVVVQLVAKGGRSRRVEIMVSDEQGLERLLEGEQDFFPAHDIDDDEWIVVHRGNLAWLSVEASEEESVHLYDDFHDVRLELIDGTSLDGCLLYSAPPEQSRVVDHLNQPTRFFELWQDGRRCLINKAYLARLRER